VSSHAQLDALLDVDPIDPARDRVWAVEVTIRYATYVVAETSEKALEIAEDATGEDCRSFSGQDEYRARELSEPLEGDGDVIPWGPTCWGDQQLTVNEAIELIGGRRPVHDTRTLLMPFADAPPPIHPEGLAPAGGAR
jgi:hypothetical protein